jgi:uncharacterized protein
MEKFNLILKNGLYNEYLKKNEVCEVNRIYCLHDIRHFLDVARIAYILKLESALEIGKDTVYAAALLHDIGKWQQYRSGIPHEEASAALAGEILVQCGYDECEREIIIRAIREHRTEGNGKSLLGELIYRSDKLSRNCFICKAEASCNWDENKKNKFIKY